MNNVAKVWNDNELPFEQIYKGDKIRIEANSYKEMEYEDAQGFASHPFPMAFDGMGQQTKESYKKIRVEGRPDTGNQVTAFKCHADGTLHASPDALNAYVQSTHSEKMYEPEEKLGKKQKV